MPRFLGVHWPRSAVPIGLAIGICFNTLPPAQGQASESPSVEAWCALDAEPAQQFATAQQPVRPAAIAQYRGNFDQFTLDGQGVLTYSETEVLNRLYTLDGAELAQFPGWFARFSPDQRTVITTNLDSPLQSVYALDGTLLTTVENFYGFTPDSQRLLTNSEAERTSELLNLEGRTIAVLEGLLVDGRSTVADTADGRGIILTIQGSPYDQTQQQVIVYDLAGQERFRRSEALIALPNQQGFLTVFGPVQRLNWDGEVQTTFEGDRFVSYLPGDLGLVTVDTEAATTYLSTWGASRAKTTLQC
jgi:hypothetical protein